MHVEKIAQLSTHLRILLPLDALVQRVMIAAGAWRRNGAMCILYASLNVINTTADTQLSIYPNPTHKQVLLTTSSNITTISVINLQGQIIISQEGSKDKSQLLNMEALNSGTYILYVTTEEGIYATKVVKQ